VPGSMILSDHTIREELASGRIVIDPLDPTCIQPSSVDLHVDRWFRLFRNHTARVIDVKENQEDLTELVEIGEGSALVLHPGEFVLGATAERVALPDDLVGRLEGKSSLGRLGLLIHSSLPGSEPVLVRQGSSVDVLDIGEFVREKVEGSVLGFDLDTLEVGWFPITGWYSGPPDTLFEVRLVSGRQVRVTAGHNLFSAGPEGGVAKRRTLQLRRGTKIVVPGDFGDPGASDPAAVAPGPLEWDEVAEMVDTGSVEPVFDLEVRSEGRRIENFVAGVGGVFVSNTAGFIDPGFDGHLTLELSNVANLPITVYPGMKIGQISFLRMTTPADVPYGSAAAGSRYQHQRGPTASRFHESFTTAEPPSTCEPPGFTRSGL
jgi:deoxycytidine triphosphate deaminase